MIAPLDPKTKKFYLEMGYSERQVQQAFECSRNTGVDMLDALAMTQEAPPALPRAQPPSQNVQGPPKVNDTYVPMKSFSYRSTTTFMTPWSKLKSNDYETFFSKSSKVNQAAKIQLREEDYPVGLLNVSNCCYLNSLLQCYYLMNSFKVAILMAEPLTNLEQALASESKTKLKRIKSEYELLGQFKKFFTTMGLTSKRYLDPTSVLQNLVDSVGDKVSYGEEKDLSEINVLIIERLSEGLEHSKNYYQPEEKEELLDMDYPNTGSTIIHTESKRPYNSIFNPRQGAIKKMFYGTRVEYYDEVQLQKEPPIVNDFTGLILHPRSGNLTRALDDQFNFQVQINGGLHKKTTFIRDQPEYLFLYINRTDYDREEGQATKNQHKFTFDFTFYLDRYLERYRKEDDLSNEKIKELLVTKNKLKEQINSLKILFKKIEECQKYAQELEGWGDKLPKEEEFEEEYTTLEDKLASVEKELDDIESRNQEYHLMYIFVHRGDAVSGHYWGYGRNGSQWYRFDINTSPIEQEQIVIDLQKSAATPYSLLYVKSSNLSSFDYKLHLDPQILKQKYPATDFRGCYDPKMATEILIQNQQLKQEAIARSHQALKNKAYSDYVARFSSIKKIVKRNEQQNKKWQNLLRINIVNNFSLFLWTRGEVELAKFTLFQQALLAASSNKMNVDGLMHQKELLFKIQKKFKKNCHKDLCLKFYSLLPKEVQKLASLYQEYQLHVFEVIWGTVILNGAELFQDQWNAERAKGNGDIINPTQTVRNYVLQLLKLLRIRRNFLKSPQIQAIKKSLNQVLYINQINNEISKILLLSISATGLKIEGLQKFTEISDQVGAQIVAINAGNDFFLDMKEIREEKADPVEEAKEFVATFKSMGNKKSRRMSTSGSAVKIPQQTKVSTKSGFKNSFLASPGKTLKGVSQSVQKEKKGESFLVSIQKEVLTIQGREQWKTQELDNLKINYQFGARLINFLKKMDPVPKIYKKVSKLEKSLTLAELKGEGLMVNQEERQVIEESLI